MAHEVVVLEDFVPACFAGAEVLLEEVYPLGGGEGEEKAVHLGEGEAG